MSQAFEIMYSSGNTATAETRAHAAAVYIDQDWNNEATIYTFSDVTVLVISGSDVNAFANRLDADRFLNNY